MVESYSASSSNTDVATASVSGSTVTVQGVAAGRSTIRTTARNSIGTATQSFRVTVTLPPEPDFSPGSYAVSIPETTSVGTTVVTVSATDPQGDAISYSTRSGNSGNRFAIGATSGAVTVARSLNQSSETRYTLTIRATDTGGNYDSATVRITVTEVVLPSAPAPDGVTASSARPTSIFVNWTALANATKYRVEYRRRGASSWTISTGSATSPGHRVGGLTCSTAYEFRVTAYGNGINYTATWGTPAQPVPARTGPCNRPPAFAADTYSFSVRDNAAAGQPVGAVSATDPDADPVAYSITAGNGDAKFTVNTETGAIAVAGDLDHDATASYNLTVQATDGNGGTDTATVQLTVLDAGPNLAPAPTGLSVALADGEFAISWESLTGADNYAVQYNIPGLQDTVLDLPFTPNTSLTFRPTGGVHCGRSYEFRMFAHGDGTTYFAAWGRPSSRVAQETSACNRAPAFSPATYNFTVREDASIGASLGSVSATDPDEDTLSYSITGGNTDAKFAVNRNTGNVNVAAPLDYETTPSYTLTLQADDGRDGTDTATVQITVTDEVDLAPAPTGLSVTLADGEFAISWDSQTGVNNYAVQYSIPGLQDPVSDLPFTQETSLTFRPTGGVHCGRTYEFRMFAHGDGTTYHAEWGRPSGRVSRETPACN